MNNDRQESRSGAPDGGGREEAGIGARTHDAAEQLKGAAQERAGKLRQGIDSAKDHAAKRARKLGVAIRAIGENMRIDDEEFMAHYADSASQRLDRVASYLSDNDAKDVIHDAEDFMRRKPAMFFGGAFLVGLAAGRFLRSSRPAGSGQALSSGMNAPSREFDSVDDSAPSRQAARSTTREPRGRDQGYDRPRGGATREPRDPRNGATT